jgi:hypothetical protein
MPQERGEFKRSVAAGYPPFDLPAETSYPAILP